MTKFTMISSIAFFFALLGPSNTLAASIRGSNAKNRELDAQACDEIPEPGDDCTEFLSSTVDNITCGFAEPERKLKCDCSAPDNIWTCSATGKGTVPDDPPPTPQITCPTLESIPNDGDSCEGFLRDGASSARCNYHKTIMEGNGTTLSQKSCECARSDETKWNCFGDLKSSSEGVTEVITQVPVDPVSTPPITCPSVESIPKNGESCDGVLAEGMSFGTCNYSQSSTNGLDTTTSSKSCKCARSDETWSCSGEIDDVSEGVTEVITPVPVDPIPTLPITCPPKESIPKNGESCDGVLAAGARSSRTCSYSQSFVVDIETFSSGTSCTCERSDEETTWSCSGEIDDVPAGDTNVHIIELSEWQCRPWEKGCSAPHTVLSYCGETKACCQGSIIDDWMTENNSCKPAVTFSEFVCRPMEIGAGGNGMGCSTSHTVADCSGTPACCPGSILDDWKTGENSCMPIPVLVW